MLLINYQNSEFVGLFYIHKENHVKDETSFFLLTYLLTYLLTHSLTPWSTVLLDKLTGLQLVKKFPAFYGTRKVH
jgi:hypothetical protein